MNLRENAKIFNNRLVQSQSIAVEQNVGIPNSAILTVWVVIEKSISQNDACGELFDQSFMLPLLNL